MQLCGGGGVVLGCCVKYKEFFQKCVEFKTILIHIAQDFTSSEENKKFITFSFFITTDSIVEFLKIRT
jgi:hypothetical protein